MIHCKQLIVQVTLLNIIAHSAEAVEYTDCFSEEG